MDLTPAQVSQLLGHKDPSSFWDYEEGIRLPVLINALKLSIILRTPVEFLFGGLYDSLKKEIRDEEERLTQSARQQTLF